MADRSAEPWYATAGYLYILHLDGPVLALIRRWQREWLKSDELEHCDDATCWRAQFADRIATLKNVASAQDSAARWHGHYVRYVDGRKDIASASITLIGLTGKRVLADGNAVWEGSNTAHSGMLQGVGRLTGERAVFDLEGCTATLALGVNGIVVEDESGSGGMNVSFVGEYRREDRDATRRTGRPLTSGPD